MRESRRDLYDSAYYYERFRHYIDGSYVPSPAHQLIKVFLDLQEKDYFLDVGCGIGFWLKWLPPTRLKVGIDHSSAGINIAEKTFPEYPWVQAESTRIPFKDNTFDKVLCIRVIEHLNDNDQDRLLEEIKRVLKPGGYLVIVALAKYSLHWFFVTLFVYATSHQFHVKQLTPNQFLASVSKHFEVIKLSRISGSIRFHPIVNKIIHFLRGEVLILSKKNSSR